MISKLFCEKHSKKNSQLKTAPDFCVLEAVRGETSQESTCTMHVVGRQTVEGSVLRAQSHWCRDSAPVLPSSSRPVQMPLRCAINCFYRFVLAGTYTVVSLGYCLFLLVFLEISHRLHSLYEHTSILWKICTQTHNSR